jgi:hypothetical protein
MTTLKAREPSIVRTAVALLATVYAATFVVAVLLHVGAEIPLGFVVLDEPRRPFAVIVEGVAGIVLAVGAFAVFAGTTRAWAAVTGAHAVALAGVLWGMVAVAAGRGPHTQLNDTYHRVMVVLLAATLLLLLTPWPELTRAGAQPITRDRGGSQCREQWRLFAAGPEHAVEGLRPPVGIEPGHGRPATRPARPIAPAAARPAGREPVRRARP